MIDIGHFDNCLIYFEMVHTMSKLVFNACLDDEHFCLVDEQFD